MTICRVSINFMIMSQQTHIPESLSGHITKRKRQPSFCFESHFPLCFSDWLKRISGKQEGIFQVANQKPWFWQFDLTCLVMLPGSRQGSRFFISMQRAARTVHGSRLDFSVLLFYGAFPWARFQGKFVFFKVSYSTVVIKSIELAKSYKVQIRFTCSMLWKQICPENRPMKMHRNIQLKCDACTVLPSSLFLPCS